jgi:hypothetical protein
VVTGPCSCPVGALKMSSSRGCWKDPGTTFARRPPLSFEVVSVEYCAATFFQFAGESSERSAWSAWLTWAASLFWMIRIVRLAGWVNWSLFAS